MVTGLSRRTKGADQLDCEGAASDCRMLRLCAGTSVDQVTACAVLTISRRMILHSARAAPQKLASGQPLDYDR